jgi:uncharacterized protein YbjT (DUF2867 family)
LVDYSNKESIKSALSGIDVVILTITATTLDMQAGIAEAAKEAGIKLFVPSEFGGVSQGATQGLSSVKAGIHNQLKALGIPYALFYTGPFSDFIWGLYVSLSSLFLP